jgi:acetyl-CoA acetyltransferase/uncharacterized OB-fold protein
VQSVTEQRPTGPIRPQPTAESVGFWQGCRDEALRFPRCDDCAHIVHPPAPVCSRCGSRALSPVEVDGSANVYSLTINHQPTRGDLPVPFALAIVELIDAPGVRLTLRVVSPPDEIAIGDSVQVEFERVDDDFTVPVARRTGTGEPDAHRSEPGRMTFAANLRDKPEDRAAITGLGRSAIGRQLWRSDLDLTIEAVLAACVDAGISLDQVDGMAAYPGAGVGPPGYSGPHTDEVARALGLELSWRRAGAEGAGQLQPLFDAVLAVAGGLCTHAVVYRTSTESTAAAAFRSGIVGPPAAGRASGFAEWLLPFDAVTPANWLAPYASRHQHQFGTTRAQTGAVALNGRHNAARNPAAVMTEPLSLDDYLGSRPISTPIHLLDCDVPVDGSTAFVVSATERVADVAHPAVRIDALGTGIGMSPSWHQWSDLTTMASFGAAATMWARTDLTPADVDVAQLYDGFSFLVLFWLESLGFCAHGDGGPFVEEGRIALGGELPLNTCGGQLSGGRLHGFGLLYEACLQLRGGAEGRQVADAEVAVVSSGGGPIAGCLLLTR